MFKALSWLIFGKLPDGYDIMLHPIAFAGWIGFFITSLNLIPVGQLDGGHILYAFIGEKHRTLSWILVSVLLVMGFIYWQGWTVWGILLIVLGTKHPPILDSESNITPHRKKIAALSLIIFILTFTPTPFMLA